MTEQELVKMDDSIVRSVLIDQAHTERARELKQKGDRSGAAKELLAARRARHHGINVAVKQAKLLGY